MSSNSRDENNLVLMGRIGAAHGIQGQVRIKSYTDDPADITTYGPLTAPKLNRTFKIKKHRINKGIVIARLEGVLDRNEAETLNGVELYVAHDKIDFSTDEDEFLYSDLEGLEVRLEDGSKFGKIRSVANYGASDIIEIKRVKGGVELFAFTKQVVPEVNVADGYITIVPPEQIEVTEEAAKAEARSKPKQKASENKS